MITLIGDIATAIAMTVALVLVAVLALRVGILVGRRQQDGDEHWPSR